MIMRLSAAGVRNYYSSLMYEHIWLVWRIKSNVFKNHTKSIDKKAIKINYYSSKTDER